MKHKTARQWGYAHARPQALLGLNSSVHHHHHRLSPPAQPPSAPCNSCLQQTHPRARLPAAFLFNLHDECRLTPFLLLFRWRDSSSVLRKSPSWDVGEWVSSLGLIEPKCKASHKVVLLPHFIPNPLVSCTSPGPQRITTLRIFLDSIYPTLSFCRDCGWDWRLTPVLLVALDGVLTTLLTKP